MAAQSQRRSIFPPLLKTYAEDTSTAESPSREPQPGIVSAAASAGKIGEGNRPGPPKLLRRKKDKRPAKKSVLRDSREVELQTKKAEVRTQSSPSRCFFGMDELPWEHYCAC